MADVIGPFPVSETEPNDYSGLVRVVMSGNAERRIVLQSVEHAEEVIVLCQSRIANSEGIEMNSAYFITPGQYKVIMICGGTSFNYPYGVASENDIITLDSGFIYIP